jgi:hypothetical protein
MGGVVPWFYRRYHSYRRIRRAGLDRPFFTVVTVQAAYMAYTGFRVLKLKDRPFQWMDVLVLVGVILLVSNFFLKLKGANIVWNQRGIWYILFYLCIILAFDLLRVFWPDKRPGTLVGI